jgi:hypothetical protein
MAQITPGATYPGLTKSLDTNAPGEPWSYRPLALVNFFRPLGADDVQGTAGAKWAKRLGVKTVFVLNDDEAYGKGIANVFEVTARRFGLKISANENIDWRQPSQKSVLTRIVASGADLVYMWRRHRDRRADDRPADAGSRPGGASRAVHGSRRESVRKAIAATRSFDGVQHMELRCQRRLRQ